MNALQANEGIAVSLATVLLLATGTAPAQIDKVRQPPGNVMEIASDDPPQQVAGGQRRDHRGHQGDRHRATGDQRDASGLRLSGGMAFTRDVDQGWFGRLEYFLYDGAASEGGGVLTIGAEGWGAEDAFGGSLPYTGNYEFRAGVLFLSVGIGFDLFLYDHVYDDGGWGLFSPNGLLALGVEINGFRFGLDGRGKYRWQFSAEDRTQALGGLLLEIPL